MEYWRRLALSMFTGFSKGTGSKITTGRSIRSNSFFRAELSKRLLVVFRQKLATVKKPTRQRMIKTPPMGAA